MPKRRSSSLSRKTKGAMKAQKRRQQESPESRERRLLQVRVRAVTSSAREEESGELRERRLHEKRAMTSAARQQESPTTRARRLEQDRLAKAAARQQESPTTRAQRLEKDRLATAAVRHLESPTTRALRLEQDRLSTAVVRHLQSLTTRARRLEQDRMATARARQQEAPTTILTDLPRKVWKISCTDSSTKDIEVEMKEEQTHTEEANKMHPAQEHNPRSIELEPASWQSSSLQEELRPKGRDSHGVYVKEEIDIKEEDIDYFNTEEVAEYATKERLFQ